METLLNEIALWSDDAVTADLWGAEELSLHGCAVAQDIAMAIVLDEALGHGLLPRGFAAGNGGLLSQYERE